MKHKKEDGTLEMMTNDYTFGGEKIKQISQDETRNYLSNPTETFIKRMIKRFGNNKPKVTIKE